MSDSSYMVGTLNVMCDVFDTRAELVDSCTVPSWPWIDGDGYPIVPDSPGERTYENYRKAAAFLVYKMEVHRGEVSEKPREAVNV